MKNVISKLIEFISLKVISPVNWTRLAYLFTGRAYGLSSKDRSEARELMETNNFIILSRRKTHLTTYLIGFMGYLLRLKEKPKIDYWTHAFLNITEEMMVEAIGKGVQVSWFDDVFDCDSICLLLPRNLEDHEWVIAREMVISRAMKFIGTKYDTKFNIQDDSKVSCIELVRDSLRVVPNYDFEFNEFESMIKKYKNLTPQMIYDSGSFDVIFEVRHD